MLLLVALENRSNAGLSASVYEELAFGEGVIRDEELSRCVYPCDGGSRLVKSTWPRRMWAWSKELDVAVPES